MLTYIGTTSPECLLNPGEPLNVPFQPPGSLTANTQQTVIDVLTKENDQQLEYFDKHKENPRYVLWQSWNFLLRLHKTFLVCMILDMVDFPKAKGSSQMC